MVPDRFVGALTNSRVPAAVAAFALALAVACGGGDDVASEPLEATSAPLIGTAPNPPVSYHGGKLLAKVKIIAVFWGAQVASTKTQVDGFYTAVTTSPYLDWLAEYNTATQTLARGTYAGLVTITPAHTSNAIGDADIATELANQIGKGVLATPDANTLYMVHFPQSAVIQGPGSLPPLCAQVRGAPCAYHSAATRTIAGQSRTFAYGVIPHFTDPTPGSGAGCWCGVKPRAFDNLTLSASHEIAEAVTDPFIKDADPRGPATAWFPEIGDNCSFSTPDVREQAYAPLVGANGTVYQVQRLWSNAKGTCQASYDLPLCKFARIAMTSTKQGTPSSVTFTGNGFSCLTAATPLTVSLRLASTGAIVTSKQVKVDANGGIAGTITGCPGGAHSPSSKQVKLTVDDKIQRTSSNFSMPGCP